ncbi:chromate transporter [Peptoniphilus catoniae]|uniref:chromate transporter n=1 Tax=Peptoniphilus catoniae TaxID=1660341 RepID=UPI001FE4D254|nr:chromate transporter [Peptoniphilus catoniae]
MMTKLLDLYLIFAKIGILAFGGGYASIPLIEKYIVEENSWITMLEFRDLVSISQMTPGPIAINSATFVGQKVMGFLGSVVATLGFVTPQLILMMILGYFLFSKGKKFKVLDWILNGIKAGIVSLIFISAIKLFKASIFPQGFTSFNISAAICFALGIYMYLKKYSLFKMVFCGAVLGLVINISMKFLM